MNRNTFIKKTSLPGATLMLSRVEAFGDVFYPVVKVEGYFIADADLKKGKVLVINTKK